MKKANIIPIGFFLFLLIQVTASAQKNSTNATAVKKIETKAVAMDYNILPLEENGFILFYVGNELTGKKEKTAYFSLYDKDLNEIWSKTHTLPERLKYLKYDYKDGKLLVMFLDEPQGVYQVVEINSKNPALTVVPGKFPKRLAVGPFYYKNGDAYISASTFQLKSKTMIYKVNMKTKSITEIKETIIPGNTSVQYIPHNFSPEKDFALVTNAESYKNFDVYFYNFLNGKPKEGAKLDFENNYTMLMNMKPAVASENEQLLAGTFRHKDAKNAGFGLSHLGLTFSSNFGAQGFFIAKAESGKQAFMKHYSFLDFKNFFNYLDEKKKEKLDNKSENKEKAAKSIDIDINLYLHAPIAHNDKYYILAEAYYIDTKIETYNAHSTGGGFNSESQEVFDGIKYSHGFIACFSKNGELLWDNFIPLEDIKTYKYRPKISVMKEGNELYLVYSQRNQVKTKLVAEDKLISSNKNANIEISGSID